MCLFFIGCIHRNTCMAIKTHRAFKTAGAKAQCGLFFFLLLQTLIYKASIGGIYVFSLYSAHCDFNENESGSEFGVNLKLEGSWR